MKIEKTKTLKQMIKFNRGKKNTPKSQLYYSKLEEQMDIRSLDSGAVKFKHRFIMQ